MIFKDIFEGWRCHQVLALTYRKPNGGEQERKFEPHIIAFHHGIWYIKGYEYGTKNIKTYAIQRITSVAFGIDTFETDINQKTGRKLSVHFELYEGAWISADSSGIWKTDRSKINVICFFQN